MAVTMPVTIITMPRTQKRPVQEVKSTCGKGTRVRHSPESHSKAARRQGEVRSVCGKYGMGLGGLCVLYVGMSVCACTYVSGVCSLCI